MAAIDSIAMYERFRGLPADTSSGVVSATFDLEPGPTGSPTAPTILKDALRHAMDVAPSTLREQVDEAMIASQLEAAIDEATAAGAAGLAVCWSPGEEMPPIGCSPTPYRNRIDIDARPWLFEVERHHALTRNVVAVAYIERSGADFVLLNGDAEAQVEELRGDDHRLRGAVGRTQVHGTGGAAGDPAGGHGKTRIESSAEEQREIWARTLVETLVEFAHEADAILIAGPDEIYARVLDKIPEALAPRVARLEGVASNVDATSLERMGRAHRQRAQFEEAAALIERTRNGSRDAVEDLEQIERDAVAGRIEALVLDERAVRHFGHATDARERKPTGDERRIEALLRACLDQGATAWFAAGEPNADQMIGALGIRRW